MKKTIAAPLLLGAALLLGSCDGDLPADLSSILNGSESSDSASVETPASSEDEPASSAAGSSSGETSSESSSSEDFSNRELEGTGTQEDPYIAYNRASLEDLREAIESSHVTVYAELGADISLAGEDWIPIGDFPQLNTDTVASVNFDGKGHSISGLSIKAAADVDDMYAAGLFGVVEGYIRNLDVSGDISFIALAEDTYAGILAGVGSNLAVNNVHTSGNIDIRALGQYQEVRVGGIVGTMLTTGSYYCDVFASSSEASLSAEAEYIGYAGGIVGDMTTSYSTPGISAVNSCVYGGELVEASTSAAGIVASTYYLASVVNSVVDAGRIEVIDTSYFGSYAGGIAGNSYYENAYLNNIVATPEASIFGFDESSYVDPAVAYLWDDPLGNGDNIGAAVSYGNILPGTALDDATLTEKGFALAYDLHGDELPTLKDSIVYPSSITITHHSNDSTDQSVEIPAEPAFIKNVEAIFPAVDGLHVGISYDSESYLEYKWFAPINSDIDVYDIWYDPAPIAGWHKGADSYNPVIYLGEDGTFIMRSTDGYRQIGTYWSDGNYVIPDGDDVNYEGTIMEITEGGSLTFEDVNADYYTYEYTKMPSYFGYYTNTDGDYTLFLDNDGTGYINDGLSRIDVTYRVADEVIYLNVPGYDETEVTVNADGTISYTLDDYDYQYDYTLTPFDGIPDYTGKSYVGRYSGLEWDVELLSNGNAYLYRPGEDGIYTSGGYEAFGNTIAFDAIYQSVRGTFRYIPDESLLLKNDGSLAFIDSEVGTYSARFGTEDGSLYVHRILVGEETVNYVALNGYLQSSATVNGTFEDGSTVTINDTAYVVSGTTLTIPSTAPDYSEIAGSYMMSTSSTVLVLNADGTGTYGDEAITFTYEDGALAFSTSAFEFELTYDASSKSFSGTFNDGYDGPWSCSFTLIPEAEPEPASLVGTWAGSGPYGTAYTVVISANGTLSLTTSVGTWEGTWTGDATSSISFTIPDFYEMTGTITLRGEDSARLEAEDYDYNTYDVDLTKSA